MQQIDRQRVPPQPGQQMPTAGQHSQRRRRRDAHEIEHDPVLHPVAARIAHIVEQLRAVIHDRVSPQHPEKIRSIAKHQPRRSHKPHRAVLRRKRGQPVQLRAEQHPARIKRVECKYPYQREGPVHQPGSQRQPHGQRHAKAGTGQPQPVPQPAQNRQCQMPENQRVQIP